MTESGQAEAEIIGFLGGEGNDTVVAYHTSGSDIIEGGAE